MKPSLLLSVFVVLLPAQASGQGLHAFLNATAGTATDERGVRGSALSFAPVLMLIPSRATVISLRASGTSFGAGRWSLGTGLDLTMRGARSSRVGVRLDASASATLSSYGTRIGALSASPVGELRVGNARFFGGAEGSIAATLSPSPLPAAPDAARRRAAYGPLFGAELRLNAAQLEFRESHQRVTGINLVNRTLTLSSRLTALQWGAGIGIQYDGTEGNRYGQAALRIPLGAAFALTGAVSWYPANRVLGTVGGRDMRAGIQLEFGGGQHRLQPRRTVEGMPSPRMGYTRLTIEAAHAVRVEIAGDWNRWTPVAARRSNNGIWYADVALTPGTYRYAFRVDGRWQVPENAQTVEDGFGGKSVVIEVTSSQGE